MVNVAIVGNCQAQALESIFMMYTDCNIVRVPAVHLLTESDEAAVTEKMSSVDVILSQRVSDDYRIKYLRTSDLKNNYANVISWPNIYFNGYFPDIEYIYTEQVGKAIGPLDDYHMRLVHYFYAQGKSVSDCTYLYNNDVFSTYYPDPIGKSLTELKERENGLDLEISTYLEGVVRQRKSFYTVNHPANFVLMEMARRMVTCIGIEADFPDVHPFALARVNIPIYPHIRDVYQLSHIAQESFVGIGRHNINIPMDQVQAKVYNSLDELIDLFYRFYDSMG